MANGEYKLVKINESATLDEKTIQAVSDKALGFDVNLDPTMLTIPTSLPASDVYAWAKATDKPTYNAGEVGAAAASHTHGNITSDGKIGIAATLPIITTTGGVLITGSFGSGVGTFCQGNDSRLSDARTPLSHIHGNITNAGAIGSTTGLPIITTTSGVLTTGTFGTAAGSFCQGNDSRLSDARIPTAHTHGNITNVGAIGSTSGLMIKTTTSGVLTTLAAGTTAQYLRGDGTWATTPTGTVTGTGTVNEISYWTGAGSQGTLPVATYPSLTELSYVKGATSSIQTQLGTKAATSHTHGNITNAGAIGSTADLAVITGVSGVLTTMSRSGIDSRTTFPPTIGATASTAVAGNDARLTDARTPISHALTSHTVSGLTTNHFLKATGATTFGFGALASGDVTTALGFTPYNASNPNNYIAIGSVTDAVVTGKVLTGYTAGTNTALAATDTILGAMGKIQGQINAKGTGTVTGTGTANEISYWTGSGSQGTLPVATYPSLTELSYVKGVTSAIQTQINAKVSTSRLSYGTATPSGGSDGDIYFQYE